MKNKRALLLLSGGIDSTTLLGQLAKQKYEITALSFVYGQKNVAEIEYARSNAVKFKVTEHIEISLDRALFTTSALVDEEKPISTYQGDDLPAGPVNAYVPYRNMIFISYALSIAESRNLSEIFVGVNKDDAKNFWDCKASFLEKMNKLSALHGTTSIKAPFLNLTKKQVVALAHSLQVNLNETLTCYSPVGTVECRECLSCRTKVMAMES